MTQNNNINKVTNSELKILEVIWHHEPVTSKEIINRLDSVWSDRTIKTLISRLVKKDIVSFIKEGNKYIYSSNITEKEFKSGVTKSFLNTIYKGSVSSLMVHLVKNDDLTQSDIDELKKILEQEGE